MILLLTAIDPYDQLREFTCPIKQLEVGFDLLNDIVAQGDTLVSARIVDENRSTSLPLDAFDGTTFLAAVQELQREWQSILSEPPQVASMPIGALSEWRQQRVRRFEGRVVILKRTLNRIRAIRQQVQDKMPFGSIPSAVISHYSTLIARYEIRLVKVRLILQIARERLTGPE